MISKYERIVMESPDDSGDLMIELGEEIMQAVGWHVGDEIEWIDNKDGSWTLRKTTLTQTP